MSRLLLESRGLLSTGLGLGKFLAFGFSWVHFLKRFFFWRVSNSTFTAIAINKHSVDT